MGSFLVYIVGIDTEISTAATAWYRIFIILDIGITFINISLNNFNPVKTYWAFLQKKKFDTIIAKPK